MTSQPSTASSRGGSRLSPPAHPRAYSLQLLIGSYFFIVVVVLILPGLFLAERSLRRRLLDTRLTAHQATMHEVVRGVQKRTAAAEARVMRYSWLVSRMPGHADAVEVRAFDRMVVRDPDGAWRPRKEEFDPGHEAGIYLPKAAVLDAGFKSFLMRGKRLTERFGAGALDPELVDAWISPADGGIVMYVPDQPTFPWELSATEDWTQTDWMKLAEPATNPEGLPRWTDPFHSEKTDAWFVSVVAPFERGGSWAGSVGQDLSWQELVDYSAQSPIEMGGRFLLVGKNGGVIMADSATARDPTRPTGRMLEDLPDLELRDTLSRLLARSDSGGSIEPQLVRTSEAYLLWSTIPATDWLVASLIPQSSIEGPISGPLRAMRWAILVGLIALSVASLVSINLEIRRRQAIEAETRRAEERFRSLFQLSPYGVGLCLLDTGLWIEMNDSFVVLSGYTREEMMGKTTGELGLWADPSQRDQVVAIVRRDGVCMNLPAGLRRKDGRVVEVECSGRSIDVEGRLCLLAIIRDVEEQRRLERQLTQAQKMEAIGRLAGGVAHDFNNIMTAVMGYAQIASESLPPDSSAGEDLGEILRAAGRASELTRQLLAFARRQVTQPRPVDLNALVKETRKLLERLLGEDVVLLTELADDLPPILIDPGQMEQVLVNLAVNARDAMPRGGSLLIKTSRSGGELMLDVSDTGVGILQEHQAHIFEPFFTTKDHGKGTGLGLATCYGIVRQAGGHIEVTSDPGKGSRFRVALPALPDGTIPDQTPVANRIDGGMPRGTERILLAEDEPQVRELALRLLRGLGYVVLVAETGAAALELAASIPEPIDLLVTDVVMPGMTGEELAGRLRKKRPEIKVLYISGYAEDSDAIEQALRKGDSFLGKPFTVPQLARRIRAILDPSNEAGDLAQRSTQL
jgi:two-component system, cell cycle sensor histidine kinase and response regulator CckA